MDSLNTIIAEVVKFRDDRDWKQFHNAKDLSLALSIEASELNELFLWKTSDEVKVEKVKEELADILNYAILIADKFQFDIPEILREKLAINALKYPIEKSRGKSNKYDQL